MRKSFYKGQLKNSKRSGRPIAEAVEMRLLFASISGKVFNDFDADGVLDPTEPGLAGWGVFLDLNDNGVRDVASSATESSTNVPKAIPDPGQTTSNLTLAGFNGTITDLDVTVNATHTWDGDLSFYLLSPTGVQITLSDQAGGVNNDGENFTGTIFDDEATDAIEDVTAFEPPYTGRYRPESPLSNVDDTDPNGVWQLKVTDSGFQDFGTLTGWSLTVTTGEPMAVANAAGNYLFADLPAGTYRVRQMPSPNPTFTQTSPPGGVHVVTVATDDDATGRNFGNRQPPGNVQGLHWSDLDGDGVHDAGEPGLGGITVYADLNQDGEFNAGAEPSTITAANGTYDLQGVPPGIRVIREVLPPGHVQTYPTSAAGLVADGGQLVSSSSPVAPLTSGPTASAVKDLTSGSKSLTAAPTPTPTSPPAARIAPVWAPSTPRSTVDAFFDAQQKAQKQAGSANFTFFDNNRWTSTATDGGGLVRGQGTTITWAVVADGTPINGYADEPASPSNLRSFLTGIYGAESTWTAKFQQIFDSWSGLTGVTYQKVNYDDGGANGTELTAGSGQLGVRADIRISGHVIDGQSNILAYNFFPDSGGDMVIDTGDSNFYGNTGGDSLGLRNVLAHEHGHGLGLDHVMPVSETKLMEPFVSYAFDGPQPDDILAANRGYGDRFEKGVGNDTIATASVLGTVNDASLLTQTVSIDGTSDTDFYQFTVNSAKRMSVAVIPTGSTYLSGVQDGPAPTPFQSHSQNDLAVAVVRSDGTVIASANDTGLGVIEELNNVPLPSAGNYYIRVTGGTDLAQMYEFNFVVASSLTGGHLVPITSGQAFVGVDFGSVPLVQSLTINDGSAQRSMVSSATVLLSKTVTLDAGAFVFAGRNGAGSATTMSYSNPSQDGRTWVLSFTGADIVNGSLADGVYDLTIVHTKVHVDTPVGASMTSDALLTFHRLFGDYDGNKTVNNLDFARFRLTFSASTGAPNFNPIFDYDGGGTVNNLDFGRFRNRYGSSVVYS